MSGDTNGHVGAGPFQSYVSKYDSTGIRIWTQQTALQGGQYNFGIASDSFGNAYMAGSSAGGAYLNKYSSSGTLAWTAQFGSAVLALPGAGAVAADSQGNSYVAVGTQSSFGGPNAGKYDVALVKYNITGIAQWTRQFGTNQDDFVDSAATDKTGNVYLSGSTSGNLQGTSAGGADAFLVKYDSNGNLQWTRQFGTSADDYGLGVAADQSGNVLVGGYKYDSTSNIESAFLKKFDLNGSLQWTREFSSGFSDRIRAVSADQLGNVYVSGDTEGNLGGPNAGSDDAFLRKYDPAGSLLWTVQIGGSGGDESFGVGSDGSGNLYFSGTTQGDIGSPPYAGGVLDAFLAKVVDVPEPPSLALACIAAFACLLYVSGNRLSTN
jgi:hypothetical protein